MIQFITLLKHHYTYYSFSLTSGYGQFYSILLSPNKSRVISGTDIRL